MNGDGCNSEEVLWLLMPPEYLFSMERSLSRKGEVLSGGKESKDDTNED